MEFRNFLLASLHPEDAAVLIPHLREVSLARGAELFDVGSEVATLYFPSSACVSIVNVMRDGKTVETVTVGRESAVLLLEAAADEPSRSRVFAQVAGGAMALPAAAFRKRLAESATLLSLTLRHALASARQAELGVSCNIAHSADGRLARWLLMTQDRTGADTFPLTQDYMAVMTGVQRSTVSNLAADLKREGIIDYSRGSLTIHDRTRLIARSCECYADVEAVFVNLRAMRR